MAKQARRDISALVEKGKLETARIKTEGIISEDIHLELLELMELYSETLLARFALLDLPTRETRYQHPPRTHSHHSRCATNRAQRTPRSPRAPHVKVRPRVRQDVMDNKDGCVPEKGHVEAPRGYTGCKVGRSVYL